MYTIESHFQSGILSNFPLKSSDNSLQGSKIELKGFDHKVRQNWTFICRFPHSRFVGFRRFYRAIYVSEKCTFFSLIEMAQIENLICEMEDTLKALGRNLVQRQAKLFSL